MPLVAEDALRSLVGHRFPGARLRVEPDVDAELRAVVGAPPAGADGLAHPLHVFLLAQRGLGISLDELFALCHATAADGPVLGEWSMELAVPLRVGASYRVRAEVADVARRRGSRAGVFDVVTTRAEIRGAPGRVDAAARTAIAYPRR